jgi:hypothetical protein
MLLHRCDDVNCLSSTNHPHHFGISKFNDDHRFFSFLFLVMVSSRGLFSFQSEKPLEDLMRDDDHRHFSVDKKPLLPTACQGWKIVQRIFFFDALLACLLLCDLCEPAPMLYLLPCFS